MTSHRSCAVGIAIGLIVLSWASTVIAEYPYAIAWLSQFGTNAGDSSESIAVGPDGSIYVAGDTQGDFTARDSGALNGGVSDVFLSRFDANGNELWAVQFGSDDWDHGEAIAVDMMGNAYITGTTRGDIGGPNPSPEVPDVFLIKFDNAGNELWRTQVGTDDADGGRSIAVDALGNAYVCGLTVGDLGGVNAGGQDVFLSKFDASGNNIWTTQMGTAKDDEARAIALDPAGNAYITGFTDWDLSSDSGDVFLGKFDALGNKVWTTQFGTTSSDRGDAIAVDALGNAYITGYTDGDMAGPNAGEADAFLSKFDSSGNEVWMTQFGEASTEWGSDLALDAFGNILISGGTYGDLGSANAGGIDAFLMKFDAAGSEMWSSQFGTSGYDYAYAMGLDTSGNAYITGMTGGNLIDGTKSGDTDGFIVKYENWCLELTGDFDGDSDIDADDIDAIGAAVRAGSTDTEYDMDGDGDVDTDDFAFYIHFIIVIPPIEVPTLPRGTQFGDFNLDGKVDILDLAILGDNYDRPWGWASGDANGDGLVGILDLGLLGDCYGYDRSTIPEPTTMSLLTMGGMAILKRRRQ